MTGTPQLKLQKRLAASVLKVGKRKVWLDPLKHGDIKLANSRQNIRNLYDDGFILKKPMVIHSRDRVRTRHDQKRKGRHMGLGKRRGTQNARMPFKVLWIRRQRVLRRMLKKYRKTKKIDKHVYRELYLQAKGNKFKNKRNLMENIHSLKFEKNREQQLKEQAEARKQRAKAKRERREAKVREEKGQTSKDEGESVPKSDAVPKQ